MYDCISKHPCEYPHERRETLKFSALGRVEKMSISMSTTSSDALEACDNQTIQLLRETVQKYRDKVRHIY